ncbi:hypothetical protein [Nakamurella lactea]|uniref:hypothetical protein n=1 Tax=Nakamurella lactea TaxID=459515 RepID=UPI000429744C|nr:hypothetical protein [Nakamurella lactea]
MTTFRRAILHAVTATAAAVVTLSSCSTTDPGTPAPAAGPSTIQQALAVVPASVTQVEIVDQAAAKKRWGLAELTGSAWTDKAQADKLKEFIKHSQTSPAAADLQTNSALMGDWGWNGMDVDWEVRYVGKDGPPVTISKLRDDLDMKEVTDSLTEHKFKQSGSGDELRFDTDMSNPSFRIFMRGLTVIPSRHLVISATADLAELPAAESSLAGNETAKALTAGLSPADYLALSVGPDACVDPIAAFAVKATPAQIEEAKAKLGDLGAIGGAAAAVLDDERSRVRTVYADNAAATADLPARQKLLTDGLSFVSQQPYSELFPGTVKAEDAYLQYDLTPELSARVAQAFQQRDTPWSFC